MTCPAGAVKPTSRSARTGPYDVGELRETLEHVSRRYGRRARPGTPRARRGRRAPRRGCRWRSTLPKSRTVMSSQTDITRSMWCSTSITDIRLGQAAQTRLPSSAISSSDRPLAGSSSSSSSGSADQRPRQRDLLAHGVGEARRVAGRRTPRCRAPSSSGQRPLAQARLLAVGAWRRPAAWPSEAGPARAGRRRPARCRAPSSGRRARRPAGCARCRARRARGAAARAAARRATRGCPVSGADEAAGDVEERGLAGAVRPDHAVHPARAAPSSETPERAVDPPEAAR